MYKKQLESIIDKNIIQEYEISTLYTIVRTLIHKNKYKTVVYGAGIFAWFLSDFFRQEGIEIIYFIDKDRKKQGRFINNIEIIVPDDISQRIDDRENIFAFICTDYIDSIEGSEIVQCLIKNGIDKYLPLRYFEKEYLPIMNGYHAECYAYYKEHKQELIEIMDIFGDDESKKVICDYVKMFMECRNFAGNMRPQREKYFGSEDDPIYYHLKDEIWINMGAQWGDNLFIAIDQNVPFKKCYAIEGNQQSYKMLISNISVLPETIKYKIETINGFVGYGGETIIKIDEYFENKEKITLINSDYKFYLRKYVTFRKDVDNETELVLYAVPAERTKNEVL